MVGILIMTHGDLSVEIVKSSELIIGESKNLLTMTLQAGADVDEFGKEFCRKIDQLDDGDGVLILTDLFAGTPSNIAAANFLKVHSECICGVNLAMLIEALTGRYGKSLKEVKAAAIEAGKESIKDIRDYLPIE